MLSFEIQTEIFDHATGNRVVSTQRQVFTPDQLNERLKRDIAHCLSSMNMVYPHDVKVDIGCPKM